MILFESDWERFPHAIVDYETKNESFKRLASIFHLMGIRNSVFLLSLLNPRLQGVDPHSPNLTDEQKLWINIECRYNFWYFLREVVLIPPVASSSPRPYKANRGNIAVSWLFHNHVDVASIQPRQTGKSVSTDCIMIWLMYIGATNSKINMLTKDATLRGINVERLKNIRNFLPPYMVLLTSHDSDNQTNLTCKSLGNEYIAGVGQNSEAAANKVGRGLTSPVQHFDEPPFIKFISTTIPASLSAGGAARDEAAEFGRPYGNIFTTTAGKKDDRDGRYIFNLIFGGAVWTESFYDSPHHAALLKLVSKACAGRKIIVNATLNHRQLGYTDEWLARKIAESGNTKEQADRDYFNIWTSGSQSSPLTPEQNATILASEIDPKHNQISKDSYIFRWYVTEEELIELMATRQIVLGVDTSDAIGRDAIALVATRTDNLATVGAATINETNLIIFAKFLAELLIMYPNMTMIPERRSSGQAIIDALLIQLPRHGIDPFRRIYNTVVDQRDEKPENFAEVNATPMARRNSSFYEKWKKSFGVATSSSSRDFFYSTVFQNAAKEAGHLVHDRTLSNEIRGLIVKNGRIDHSNDSHDDHVIAWLMTHWMLTHSKNLQYYGIDTNQLLSKVHFQGRQLTPEEEMALERQDAYREEIEVLYDQLREATDEFIIARLEARLFALNNLIVIRESEAFSIDALVQQAAEARDQGNRRRAVEARRQSTGARDMNMSRQWGSRRWQSPSLYN